MHKSTHSLFDTHSCHAGTKHPVPDRIKLSFAIAIFDIRAL